jgi:alpha-D-ribose 1-methylphosphonate 5-triphosphate synthase subunit PhnG
MQTSSQVSRQAALGVLAKAEMDELSATWQAWGNPPRVEMVRAPETGLVMLRGRIGGGGAPFNVGEATVSRASVRLDSGETGHGYCLGRDTGKALLIATIDALYQQQPEVVEDTILQPLRVLAAARDARQRDEAAATRVDFFTMVRGDE